MINLMILYASHSVIRHHSTMNSLRYTSQFFITPHGQVSLLFAKSTWLKSVKIKSLLIALQASFNSITN